MPLSRATTAIVKTINPAMTLSNHIHLPFAQMTEPSLQPEIDFNLTSLYLCLVLLSGSPCVREQLCFCFLFVLVCFSYLGFVGIVRMLIVAVVGLELSGLVCDKQSYRDFVC